MGGITRQQVLLLAILLFFSIVILGCLCLLVVENPAIGGPAFVF